MIQTQVVLNLDGLGRFRSKLDGSPEIVVALKQWAARYRGFVQSRFNKYSKGGGDWAPLKPSTIARRRKGKGRGLPAILRDTGLLFAALNPTLTTGGVERIQSGGSLSVTVGYGGNQRHKGGTATIADIARIHNEGLGNVPRRRIIVEPTEAVLKAMTADMNRALKKLADEVSK